MRAICYHQYGPPSVLRLCDLDERPLPPGHVRVAMQAAGVAPVDAKLRAGRLQHLVALDLPKVPGRDGAGVITALGEGVHTLQVGEAVCVMPSMAGRGTTLAELVLPQEQVVRKPDVLSMQQAAALLQPACSAWIALMQTAPIAAGMKVFIHAGSGAVGSLMVQLAAHLGAEVTASCRSSNVEYVAALGASRVLAYDRDELGRVRDQDVVIDLVGGAAHDQSYRMLRRGGQLVWLVAAPIRERGEEFGVCVRRALIVEDQSILQQVAALAQQGVWRPAVSGVLPMQEIARAHQRIETGEVTRGRLVLDIG
ncbi:quinone oxidoreductase family protein [Herbaspirillum seropedicae]|uniref:quinone oxidoreductase family protein n=1 Tax=Herbaspirillum seropedicae TaxID=964 RepID=UPI002854AFE4|nr:NADP-dependent oxidoreductase [Herbaspirillum seropedicae]MDR6396812.1 NADPH:quinone reductase-like Zn-dependent oxidoreductase [Herbaspirillum seropedicae]